MKPIVLDAAAVVTPTGILEGAGVRIEGDRITSIGPVEDIAGSDDAVVRAEGCLAIPGLIDIHVHGGGGRHFHREGGEGLDALLQTLATWGVTGCLPTLGALPPRELREAVARLCDYPERSPTGAQVFGLHLEGPYFNPLKKGAQNAEAIRPPDPAETKELLALAKGAVRLVTLAPEMPGAEAVLDVLSRGNVVVSAGHTEASWEDLKRTVSLGVRHATHTGNAMVGIHHRIPGTLGAVLALDEINCELIGDGVHVHPAMMKVFWRSKGTDRLILVSDATASAGLPDGEYSSDGRTVTVTGNKATLPDGTLAGSCSPLHVGVHNMVSLCGASVHEAVRMASLNPARVIGCDDLTGSIEVGKQADLVLTDCDFKPRLTMVRGRIVYDVRQVGDDASA